MNTDSSIRLDGLCYARLVGDGLAGLDRMFDMSWYTCQLCSIVHFKRLGSRHIHKEIEIS